MAVDDPTSGPVIVFGHGGVAVETIDDKALAPPPLDLRLAHALIEQTGVARVLRADRDVPEANRDAVATVLVAPSEGHGKGGPLCARWRSPAERNGKLIVFRIEDKAVPRYQRDFQQRARSIQSLHGNANDKAMRLDDFVPNGRKIGAVACGQITTLNQILHTT